MGSGRLLIRIVGICVSLVGFFLSTMVFLLFSFTLSVFRFDCVVDFDISLADAGDQTSHEKQERSFRSSDVVSQSGRLSFAVVISGRLSCGVRGVLAGRRSSKSGDLDHSFHMALNRGDKHTMQLLRDARI